MARALQWKQWHMVSWKQITMPKWEGEAYIKKPNLVNKDPCAKVN